MENKERFIRAIARWQNFQSHLETKMRLLEKAFGSDTQIFDFDGLDELFDTVVDMAVLMFPNLKEEEIKENLSWYLYEAVDMEEPVVSFKEKEWKVINPEILYDMLYEFNKAANK